MIAKADIMGTGMLSSIGLYASVIAPTNAPIKEGNIGRRVNVLKNPTKTNVKVPSTLFLDFNGNLCFPNFLPTIVDAESPNNSINIPE